MQLDLIGRINNIKLPTTRALNPLFETVANSIHAIEDAQISKGKIDIYVKRDKDPQQLAIEGMDRAPIIGFRVEDNGIGFVQENWESFNKSDSRYKAAKGGKGVGRFIWLKAFESVHVTSIYEDGSSLRKREFNFLLTANGVENDKDEKIKIQEVRRTMVELLQYKHEYQKQCPKLLKTIASRLIEHCLVRFLDSNCPTITIYDDEESLVLNDLFTEEFTASNTQQLKIKNQNFNVLNIRLYGAEDNKHRVHFVARGREVLHELLSSKIVDLAGKLPDGKGKMFTYSAYVTGELLDTRVNQERTGFDLLEPPDDGLPIGNDVTIADLVTAAVSVAKEFLKDYIAPIRAEKERKYTDFINNDAPQFRHLPKHRPEMFDRLAPGLSSDKLKLALAREDMELEIELQERGNKLLSKPLEDIKDTAEYQHNSEKLMETISEVSKSKLSQYVIHRKLILSLLENSLKLKDEEKYHYEENIHSIIFPMKVASNDIEYHKQNLWIIDERLTFHRYLASDQRFSQVEVFPVGDERRADLLIFNASHAFGEGEDPYQSVVIIEFKRPGRDNYTLDSNPVQQVMDYAGLIRSNQAKDNDGTLIEINDKTPFFAYVICDITPTFEKLIAHYDLERMPEVGGFYRFHKHYGMYIEVISFKKLLRDARKRNRVLFDLLKIPH